VAYAVKETTVPAVPKTVSVKELKLSWENAGNNTFWYRIYRSNKPDFRTGPSAFVTFVAKGTTGFKDNGEGFDGALLKGDWYYRITAVSASGMESAASAAVKISY
jgi:hypothetical protein